MFSIQEDEEEDVAELKEVKPTIKRRSLIEETIAEEEEEEEEEEEKQQKASSSGSSEAARTGNQDKGTRGSNEVTTKGPPASSSGSVNQNIVKEAGSARSAAEREKQQQPPSASASANSEASAFADGPKPAMRRRERSVALPNIMEQETRSAKKLWNRGKMKLSALRGFAKGGGAGGDGKDSGDKHDANETKSKSKDQQVDSPPPASGAPKSSRDREGEGSNVSPEASGSSIPASLGRKRQSMVVSAAASLEEASPMMGQSRRTSTMMRRESSMMIPGQMGAGGRRESSMMLGGRRESQVFGGRRESQMFGGRRESQMFGGRRESQMFSRRESQMMHDGRMGARASSIFTQAEFDQEMSARQRLAKQHQSVKIMSEKDAKEHEKAKAERLTKRDEVLTYNERVKRVIAKWKMREVQSMFLSWKRYTKKQAKAREAEEQVAPYLEVLHKESWERDEKDVDLLYSFMQKVKFFKELEENMSRDLCKMLKLEEYDEDEIVVRQGDEGDSFYVILYGSVSIWLEPKEDLERSSNEDDGSYMSGSEGSGGQLSAGEEASDKEAASGSESSEDSSENENNEEGSSSEDGEVEEKSEGEGAKDGEQEATENTSGENEEGEEEEEEEGGRILLCTRGPGDSFGELSLLKNQPRAATVQTDEPTFFVLIDKPDYDRTIKTRHQRKILDKVDFLCKLPVFQKCNITELAEFVCYLSEVDHPRNKIILGQGSDASNVHFVVRGTVQVIKSVPMKSSKNSDQREFGHALLGVYGPGSFFGHYAILMKTDQPYSIVTVVETTTYVLSLHDFFLRLNNVTLQIIKESLHDNLTDEQTQTCITQHLTSSQYRKTLIETTLPTKSPKANSHTSVFRNYDVVRKKNAELNAKFNRTVSNGKKASSKQKKIEDLLGDDEETEVMEDLTVKYGLGAASDALKDKTHDLAKFIQARTISRANPSKKDKKDLKAASKPRMVTDLRIEELIDHNETFMDFTTDCALLVGKVIADDENALIPHDLMDRVFEECNKAARNYHLVFLRWSTNSFRLISEPIHSSREKLSSKEMLIKIADAALLINKCIEQYNDEMYEELDMMYENAAGIAYGTAFLRKNSRTKEICDIEGQVYDIAAELCSESTAFGGVRCNVDICEQLNLTHSLITSGSQFVLDERLEVTVDQASVYTSIMNDEARTTADNSSSERQQRNSNDYMTHILEPKINNVRKYSNISGPSKAKSIFNRSINDVKRNSLKLPMLQKIQNRC